jgi:hypothetical protein
MNHYALLIVDDTTPTAIVGRLVDPEKADAAWPTVEVRFGKPQPDRTLGWREKRELEDSALEREEKFDLVCATIQKSSMIRLEYAHGAWDPEKKSGFVSAYGTAKVCEPAATAGVLAFAREVTPQQEQEEQFWHFGSYFTRPFARKVGELADPGFDPEKDFGPNMLTEGIYEGECAEDEARHQPDEGILYVHGPDRATVLDKHGAYMFYADGTEYQDVGLKGIPQERGVYYFTGKPWGYGPDHNGEYDSGIDVVTAVLAGPEHYALFGATAESYEEDIEEYRNECDEDVPAPSA